jgi:hypothetical protein|uniref:Uncharacterized protein n=1 Tax=viral metagenome TaxID=1070528 RepID=A0A6C0LVR0_9ZZZZ
MSGTNDSTNIDDLPTSTSPANTNITMSVNENPTEYKPLNDVPQTQDFDGKSVNEMLSQTNQIASMGALELPIRDIPRNTHDINVDEQVNNEYMHDQHRRDYIDGWENNQQMIYDQQRSDTQQDNMEVLYEQFQIPILIMLLYFFFHLPVVNKWFHKTFTFCFMKDGNMNFQGFILKSIIFATLFYVLHRNITYLSKL